MTTKPKQHPMRDLEVIVYQRVVGGSGPLFLGKYEPFHVHPIFFQGDTQEEVFKKAKDFADDAVAKHEATYLARLAHIEKVNERKAKKKALDELP